MSQALALEALIKFFLMFVIVAVALDERAVPGAAADRWLRHGSPPAIQPAGIVEPELVRLEA